MDWQTILTDAGTIASVSTAIFFVIDFVKKLYYKLPWGWTQKTPGEVWFALSILFGVGVAILVYWDNFFGSGATITGGISATVYGLVSGAGSKFMNSIFGTAGAKLKVYKEEAKAKTAAITNGKKEEAAKPSSETMLGDTVQAPVFKEEATPSLEERVEEVKQKIEERIKQTTFVISPDGETIKFDHVPTEEEIKESFNLQPLVEVVKKISPEGDYVIIDGTVYKLTKEA